MEKMLKNKLYIAIFSGPALLVFALTFIIPICHTLISSFYSWDGISEAKFILFDNYKTAFTADPVFWQSVVNIFICVLMSLVIQLPIAFIFALILSTSIKGSVIFRKIFFIPVILSTTMVSVLWMKIYDPNNGLLNGLLNILNLGSLTKEWLAEPEIVLPCTYLSAVWQFVGNHMLIMYAGLKNIPETYYEAAQIDGAKGFRIVWNITLPLMSNVLKVCVVLAVIGSLKVFDSIYIMTAGGPFNSSMTLALWMYLKAFRYMEYGYGSTLAVLLVVLCLLISGVINRFVARKSTEF